MKPELEVIEDSVKSVDAFLIMFGIKRTWKRRINKQKREQYAIAEKTARRREKAWNAQVKIQTGKKKK